MQDLRARGKVLGQLINLRDKFKESDKVVAGYVSSIIDTVMTSWPKVEELPPITKK